LYALNSLCVYIMVTMSKDNNNSEKTAQESSQWAELIGELFNRLTGKGASVTYSFENFTIDIPRAVGPRGQELGSAKWTINGKLLITAESYKSSETD
jgi:hypothetical protein